VESLVKWISSILGSLPKMKHKYCNWNKTILYYGKLFQCHNLCLFFFCFISSKKIINVESATIKKQIFKKHNQEISEYIELDFNATTQILILSIQSSLDSTQYYNASEGISLNSEFHCSDGYMKNVTFHIHIEDENLSPPRFPKTKGNFQFNISISDLIHDCDCKKNLHQLETYDDDFTEKHANSRYSIQPENIAHCIEVIGGDLVQDKIKGGFYQTVQFRLIGKKLYEKLGETIHFTLVAENIEDSEMKSFAHIELALPRPYNFSGT